MKKLTNYFLLLLFIITSIQCNNSDTQTINPKSPNSLFEQLDVLIPDGYPSNILEFKESDFSKILFSKYRYSEGKKADITKFAKLYNRLMSKYPDVLNMNNAEFVKLKKYFPTLEQSEVIKNKESILTYFERLVAYDLVQNIAETYVEKEKNRQPSGLYDDYNSFQQLNSQEQGFLIFHGRMVNGVNFAKNNAQSYSDAKIDPSASIPSDPNGRYQTTNDALRHSILTALIAKHGGKNYGSVNKAADLAIEFTDRHEDGDSSGAPEIDHMMDKHNNRVGAEYFRSVGYLVNGNCFWGICGHDVAGPDDQTMVDALYSKGFQFDNSILGIIITGYHVMCYIREYNGPIITE